MPVYVDTERRSAERAGMLSAVTNNNEVEIVRVKAVLDAAALVYAPEEHGPLLPVTFYRAQDGVVHQVCINLHPEVGWRVIDLAATFVGRVWRARTISVQVPLPAQGTTRNNASCSTLVSGRSPRSRTQRR